MRDEELQYYVRERKLLLTMRDNHTKMWTDNSISINEIVLQNLIELGLFRETWNLVKEQVHVKLYIQHGEIQKQITDYLDKLSDIGSIQYLQVEKGVILRSTPNAYCTMPHFEFTIGTDVKDFVKRNKITVRDSDIENKIKELQKLQQEYSNV